MRLHASQKCCIPPLIVLFVYLYSANAAAQVRESNNSSVLEEVMVTAQKREQSIQDVPISIVAVEGGDLRQRDVQDLYDLSASVPNLYISESFTQGYMSIRGVTSGANPGFESTVGIVVDGYYYPRNNYSRFAFLDIERVEVLRGPQGALIGKNTTAGAISITTAKPTDHIAGWAQASGELEGDEGYTLQAAVSGPFSENLKGRVAVRWDDHDGFLKNTFTGDDTPSREDIYSRGTLLWEPIESLSVTASYSLVDLHANGRPIELISCDDPLIDNLLAAAGRSGFEDCTLNFRTSSDFGRPPLGPGQFDDQDSKIHVASITLEWNAPVGTFTSLTGYSSSDFSGQQSGYSTALPGRAVDFGDDYKQFSQEIRLVSKSGDWYDYIVGGYYLHAEQDTLTAIHLFGAFGPRFSINIRGDQESDAYSAFSQFTWHVGSKFDITLEGRYTNEDKQANLKSFVSALFNPAAVLFPLYNLSPDRNESHFSPGLTVSWKTDADTHFYGSVRRGFKGGGFNHFLQANSNAQAMLLDEFEEEKVNAFELGAKLILAGGKAELHAALFHSKFDDLQVTANEPELQLPSFSVRNAATATSQGVEVELRLQPTGELTLGARAAYLDAEYDNFPDSACELPRNASVGCFPSPVNGQPVQDLSGEPLPFAPDWSYAIDAEYVWPLASGWSLYAFGEVVYSSKYFTEFLLDSDTLQGSWTKLNVGLGLIDKHWQVQVIGRNLTDEKTFYAGGDIPVSIGRTTNGIPDPPRSLVVQATYKF